MPLMCLKSKSTTHIITLRPAVWSGNAPPLAVNPPSALTIIVARPLGRNLPTH